MTAAVCKWRNDNRKRSPKVKKGKIPKEFAEPSRVKMVQDKVICTQRDITKLFDSIMYQNQLCVLSKIRSCPSEISTKVTLCLVIRKKKRHILRNLMKLFFHIFMTNTNVVATWNEWLFISIQCRKKVEKLMEKTKRCGHHQKVGLYDLCFGDATKVNV